MPAKNSDAPRAARGRCAARRDQSAATTRGGGERERELRRARARRSASAGRRRSSGCGQSELAGVEPERAPGDQHALERREATTPRRPRRRGAARATRCGGPAASAEREERARAARGRAARIRPRFHQSTTSSDRGERADDRLAEQRADEERERERVAAPSATAARRAPALGRREAQVRERARQRERQRQHVLPLGDPRDRLDLHRVHARRARRARSAPGTRSRSEHAPEQQRAQRRGAARSSGGSRARRAPRGGTRPRSWCGRAGSTGAVARGSSQMRASPAASRSVSVLRSRTGRRPR